MALTRRQRLRRVGLLCCHCLRNLAYYMCWHEAGQPRRNEQFWVSTNGAFLDIAVLKWCKIFGDSKGKHRWAAVVTDVDAFIPAMAEQLGIARGDFDSCRVAMVKYRDRFVAHLDDLEEMNIPVLTIAKDSTMFLYRHLREVEDDLNAFHDAPADIAEFYERFVVEAHGVYGHG